MVIYLAGLQGIPGELYEAATVDGANWWHKFKSITLPMLTPTTFFIMVMLTINSFKVFDLILVMTGGGPGRATNVLVYQIYNEAFINFKFGYSSAIAMVLFGLVIGITLIQFKLEEKWVNYF
jgi:ABC-type sugar transport system permease subunit